MSFSARWSGACASCGRAISHGDRAEFAARADGKRGIRHAACPPTSHVYAPGAAPKGQAPTSSAPPLPHATATPTHANANLEECEAGVLLAVESYVIALARAHPQDAKRADLAWAKYLKVKAHAYGRGTTTNEAATARRRALACALAVLDALTGRKVDAS